MKKLYVLLGICTVIFMLFACNNSSGSSSSGAQSGNAIEWKMVTAWPKDFPGIGIGANEFADLVGTLSNGRLTIKVYGAGELVGPLEIFDAVSRGVAEVGHGASYYWKGKSEAAQFFATVPFGMTAQQYNAWIYYGGGLELWAEIYDKFNLVPLAAGNTGLQMGGWFNKEINSLDDIKGLKMRIPGIAGDILKEAGGIPVLLPGAEIFPSMQSGAIDATEWVAPYNDLAFGLDKTAKYYYYPGWHEPGTAFEAFVNRDAYNSLSEDLKVIVRTAAKATNLDMISAYTAEDAASMKKILANKNIQLKRFPDSVMKKLYDIAQKIYQEKSKADPEFAKVYASYKKFLDDSDEYLKYSEGAYWEVRRMLISK